MKYDELEIFNRILGDIPFDDICIEDFNDESPDIEMIQDHIPDDCSIAYGVSKIVIIPKNYDYVIKIPFHSGDEQEFDYYTAEVYSDGYKSYHRDYDTGHYCEFENAHYVLTGEYGWNYCEAEAQVFDLAREEGLEKFFAETRFIGCVDNAGMFPVYVQEKVTIYSNDTDKSHNHTDEENAVSRKKVGYAGTRLCSPSFVTDMVNTYGAEDTRALLDFLHVNDLSDFHSDNCGYMQSDGRPVLSDYSSFNA